MEKSHSSGRFLPYISAVVVFLAITVFCFAPQFGGKTLRMHDIVQYEGSVKDIADYNEQYGKDPQWTGNSFSGMPGVLISMRQDSMILKWIFPALDFLGRPGSLIFIAMAAFFVMLLMFGVNPWIGIIPSLAYGLSTYFFIIIGAGHITKMVALAYAPLVVGSVYYTLNRNMWLGAAMTALFASLEIAANHPQITYYFGFILVALWINEGIKAYKSKALTRFGKATGLLAIAAVMAFGSNLAPLYYTHQYSKYSIRGGSELTPAADAPAQDKGLDLDYATAWSYGKVESFNMLIPDLMGGSSDGGFSTDGDVAQALGRYGARQIATQLPAYWGDQPITAGPTYLGAVIIFLFILALFLLGGSNKWWVVVVSVVALFLSWGYNFMWFTELFFNWFPGYDKFRTVAMILVIVGWTVPFLAALVLHKLWNSEIDRKRLKSGIIKAVITTGGICLFFLVLGGALFTFSSPTDARMELPQDIIAAMQSERKAMLIGDSLRSLIFVLLSAGTVWLHASGKLKKLWLVVILSALVCTDLIPVNMRYLPWSRFVEPRQTEILATDADRRILEDKDLGYRVANFTVSPFNDATTSYFHRSIGGYHGAKLQRYQDVIDRYLSRMDMEVYNMLNTRYFIVPDEQTGKPVEQYNPDANGAAWFVDTIIPAENADSEIKLLGTIDNKHEAVIDERFSDFYNAPRHSVDPSAWIRLMEYQPNKLVYQYHNPADGVAVFSEIYYEKGWEAFIDGQPAPHFRADYILRAMDLPAGSHTVEFRYRATGFSKISAITLTFSIIILLAVAVAATATILCHKKRKENEQ